LADDRIENLEAEIERLANANIEMQRMLDGMRNALVRRLDAENAFKIKVVSRLSRMEHATAETGQLVKSILASRIWKSLQRGGGWILKLSQMAEVRRLAVVAPVELSEGKQQHIQIHADGPPQEPAAGTIEFRGWAVAPDGIASVEIQVGPEKIIRARYGTLRSDIACLFPDAPDAAHSGYLAGFNTRELKDGIYRVTVRVRSRGGKAREIHTNLIINQEMGKISEYARWLELFDTREDELIQLQLSGLHYRPKISVLVPVFKTHLQILQETIDSVRRQSYTDWELCLVDDGSGNADLTDLLERNALSDRKIRFATRTESGGISAATNDALAMATGEYIALLDHDDLLSEDALFHMVLELQKDPRADLLYSDEDHIDEIGRRFSPFFKPDWSPDLILSENYVCHFMVFRRDLALAIGGFRSKFDLSQDHDILLRMSAKTPLISHVPKVLYHWRTMLDSMDRASNSTEKAMSSSRAVVEDFVATFVDAKATVEEGIHPGRWRVRYPVPTGARVSILIPTAGKLNVLERNLRAMWTKAGYKDYEIVIIDNSRDEKSERDNAVEKYVEELRRKGHPIRRFDQRGKPFNYSRLNNLAVQTCDSPLLLFLNDDTEGISDGWLAAMVELAMRQEVGAVGAKLLYPNGLIQHGGVTMGLAGICGHSFKHLEGNARHYFDFPDVIRNVSAVTAACVMTRQDVFRSVHGFDEAMFPIAYNDIDFALRIGAAGYRVLYTPHAQLYHFEALSKLEGDMHPHPCETQALKARWREAIARDPFYNPNLTRQIENWSLRWD
jgi:GT2 family glycosyltransferase